MQEKYQKKNNNLHQTHSNNSKQKLKEKTFYYKSNRKTYKIFIVNILIFIFLFIGFEICSYQSYKEQYKDLIDHQSKIYKDSPEIKQSLKIRYSLPRFVNYTMSPPKFNGTLKKTAIITIGCSYTAGIGLKDEQTFAAQLRDYTQRTTYNMGISGSGAQMVYKQLSDKSLKNKVPDVDYVIYTFIYDHIRRQFQTLLSCYVTDIVPTYSICGNTICQNKTPFYYTYSLFTVKKFLEYKNKILAQNEKKNNLPLFYKTMEESVKEMKEKYPNAKFVLMEFPVSWMCKNDYVEGSTELTSKQIERLENIGIIYINAEKLAGHDFRDIEKYRVADKDHPNERVWKELVPLLTKELGI